MTTKINKSDWSSLGIEKRVKEKFEDLSEFMDNKQKAGVIKNNMDLVEHEIHVLNALLSDLRTERARLDKRFAKKNKSIVFSSDLVLTPEQIANKKLGINEGKIR